MTLADVIHVGDVGTIITLTIYEDDETTAVDVSSATTKTIYVRKPSGTKDSWTATFTTDGSDGKITYTTTTGDIDETGTWLVQGYVEIGTSKHYSTRESFRVFANLT